MPVTDAKVQVLARIYVLCVFLDRAADVLPSDAPPAPHKLAGAPAAAIATFWHVYHAPQLHGQMYEELMEVIRNAAAAPAPQISFVECTAGTWERLREVFRLWTEFDMDLAEERRIADKADHIMRTQSAAFIGLQENQPGMMVRACSFVLLLHAGDP